MAGFVRENVYRLQIGNETGARQFLCMEFLGLTGAPSAAAWIETETPQKFDKKEYEWKGGQIQESAKVWVYGREILDKKRVTAADMAVYWICDALARGAVAGNEEANNLVHVVLVEWFLTRKARCKPLRDAAPKWWALLTKKET